MSDQFDAYDDFLKEADKDDRVGHHKAIVVNREDRIWPSGDPFTKVVIELLTANRAKADFNIQPLPTPEQIKAESGTWTTGKKKAIAAAISLQKNLLRYYGKKADDLKVGDEIAVNIVKNKEGFCRVAAILPPTGAEGKPKSDVPF